MGQFIVNLKAFAECNVHHACNSQLRVASVICITLAERNEPRFRRKSQGSFTCQRGSNHVDKSVKWTLSEIGNRNVNHAERRV